MQELISQILEKRAARRQDIMDIETACDEHGEYSYEDSMYVEYYGGMIEAYNEILTLVDERTAQSKKIIQELMDYYKADADVSTNEIDAEYYIGQVDATNEAAFRLGIF